MPPVIIYDSEAPQQPPSNAQKSLSNIPGMPEIVIDNLTAAAQPQSQPPPPVSVQPWYGHWNWHWSYPYPAYVYPQPQQQQQQQVIIIKNELPKPPPPPKEEKKKEEKKKEEPKPEPPPPPPPPPVITKELEIEEFEPQNRSKLSYASLLLSFLGFVLGIACIAETYKAGNARHEAEEAAHENYNDDLSSVIVDDSFNTIVLRLGSISSFFYFMATLCSWLAGSRHVKKVIDEVDETCVMKTVLIAGWVAFAIAFTTSLIVMMLALDEENAVLPGGVWTGFIMYLVSWMLMYGYSEMARKM
jgi:hypothetical protein